MRTWRLTPAVIAMVLFLVAANSLVVMCQPEPAVNDPGDEAHLVYFALIRAGELPDHLDESGLKRTMEGLDPKAAEIADRFEVESWAAGDEGSFDLTVRHVGSGRGFRISKYGVAHGG